MVRTLWLTSLRIPTGPLLGSCCCCVGLSSQDEAASDLDNSKPMRVPTPSRFAPLHSIKHRRRRCMHSKTIFLSVATCLRTPVFFVFFGFFFVLCWFCLFFVFLCFV